jgi:hypothetical protein
VYKLLQGGGRYGSKVLVGIPSVHWHGTEGDYRVMVMDLLGPNLDDLFGLLKYKFSLKTVLIIVDQTVSFNFKRIVAENGVYAFKVVDS